MPQAFSDHRREVQYEDRQRCPLCIQFDYEPVNVRAESPRNQQPTGQVDEGVDKRIVLEYLEMADSLLIGSELLRIQTCTRMHN